VSELLRAEARRKLPDGAVVAPQRGEPDAPPGVLPTPA